MSYFLVEENVLPDVFLKVVEAKRILAQGQAASLSQATKMAGISRSAFYKYKDSVYPYRGDETHRMATIYCELCDEPGVLSSLLTTLHQNGANIITINQNIPVDGVAPVTISMRVDGINMDASDFIKKLKQHKGLVNIRLLANE